MGSEVAEILAVVDVVATSMKKQKKISLALASASCALLGVSSLVQADSHVEAGDWEFKAAIE